MVRGLVLLNISLRMLHITKQEWWKKPFVKAVQTVLRGTNLGQSFFKSVASKKAVKNILQQASVQGCPRKALEFLFLVCVVRECFRLCIIFIWVLEG